MIVEQIDKAGCIAGSVVLENQAPVAGNGETPALREIAFEPVQPPSLQIQSVAEATHESNQAAP